MPWLLTVIMLGMGMTLRPVNFAVIVKRPWALLLGVAAQYSVMPLLGWAVANALGLDPLLTAGMILVGSAPGRTASNVMAYVAKGDAAVSVSSRHGGIQREPDPPPDSLARSRSRVIPPRA